LVDELTTTGKTREAATALTALAKVEGFDKLNYKSGRRALVALPERTPALTRGFRNLPSAVITPVSDLNTLDLLSYRYLVVVDPQNSLPALAARLEKK
jgi:ribosomal protein L4